MNSLFPGISQNPFSSSQLIAALKSQNATKINRSVGKESHPQQHAICEFSQEL